VLKSGREKILSHLGLAGGEEQDVADSKPEVSERND